MQSSSHNNSQTTDFLKKIRKIEIRTKALSHQIFAGEYHSAFKGRGMAFSEVREYQYGDDVRNMDWNVTARLRAPYVKVFEEEREMTVMLLVAISRTGVYGKLTSFLLSDMMDTDTSGAPRYEDAIKVAAGRHDLSVIKVFDPRERTIPDIGLVNVKDSETGETAWINTSSSK